MFYIGMTHENTFMFHDYTIKGRCWDYPLGPVDPWDEALANDKEMFPRVHIHVEREGSDCDGVHGDSYIWFPSESDNYTAEDVSHHVERERESLPGTFSLDKFWRNAVDLIVNHSPYYRGSLTVLAESEYDREAKWHEGTDEGYSHAELRMCIDECDNPTNTHYDQYAQAMNY